VDGNYIPVILPHELVDILAELVDHFEHRGLMIIEFKVLALLIKAPISIASLAAEVINFIESCMLFVEELKDIPH
jgi:hypothetical protein